MLFEHSESLSRMLLVPLLCRRPPSHSAAAAAAVDSLLLRNVPQAVNVTRTVCVNKDK